MAYNGLTNAGAAYLAARQANNLPIEFLKAKVGNGTIPDGTDPAELTDIISGKMEVEISDIQQVERKLRMTVQVSNESLTTGFYLTEIAIFVNDNGTSVLYWYIGKDNGTYVPDSSKPMKYKNILNIEVSSTPVTTVNYTGKDLWVDEEKLNIELDKKEDLIDKKTGFNLDKTNSYELDDINKLVTAKALYNFNQKTKADYEPKISVKNTGFNLNKTDSFNESDTNKLVTAKALSDAYSLVLGNNFGGYIQTAGLKQKGKIYISNTSDSLFVCTADIDINYVDYNYFSGSSLIDILRTTFSQAVTVLTPTQGFTVTYRQVRGQLVSIIFQHLLTANPAGVEYFLPFPINAIATATATSASTNNYVKLVASTENTFKLFCDTTVTDVQVQLMVYAKNALIDW
ncbi:hypothetical protein [Fusobacterium sp.]|uniref:hypothetical protein n=1 Tax=Fusobacterium sp. TaxID=68766 RepID=UPI0029021D29|nr:hypothetical protein [Fusobacterium sp.]MDU1909707.1 hypothetical protein [Fusobacterium sp.]